MKYLKKLCLWVMVPFSAGCGGSSDTTADRLDGSDGDDIVEGSGGGTFGSGGVIEIGGVSSGGELIADGGATAGGTTGTGGASLGTGGDAVELPPECMMAAPWISVGSLPDPVPADSVIWYGGSFWLSEFPENAACGGGDEAFTYFDAACPPGDPMSAYCGDCGQTYVPHASCSQDVPVECSGALGWQPKSFSWPFPNNQTPVWYEGRFWVTAEPEDVPDGFPLWYAECPPTEDVIPGVTPDKCFEYGNTWKLHESCN